MLSKVLFHLLQSVRQRQLEVSARRILSSYLLNFLHISVWISDIRELFEEYTLIKNISHSELHFEVFAELLACRQVKCIARHLITVRHSDVFISLTATHRTTHANNTLTDTVIEKVDVKLCTLILIEETGVDKVRRLALHRTVIVDRAFIKFHATVDE